MASKPILHIFLLLWDKTLCFISHVTFVDVYMWELTPNRNTCNDSLNRWNWQNSLKASFMAVDRILWLRSQSFLLWENTPWLNVVDTLQRQLSTNPPLYLCMCQSFHQAVDSASLALNLDWLCGRLQPIGLVAEVISASAGAQPFPARQLLHLLSWNISHAIRNSCWSQAILLKSKVTRKGF